MNSRTMVVNESSVMKFKWVLLFMAAWCGFGTSSPATAADCKIIAEGLKCENLVNPLGIDMQAPQLSWQLTSLSRGQTRVDALVIVEVQTATASQTRICRA